MPSTNGTNGVHHEADEAIDSLYEWMPGLQPTAPPCPEALFSCTLRGTLDGIETLLTIRGMSASEFQANLASVRGLLDPPKPAVQPVASPGPDKGFCAVHQVAMKENEKEGRRWFSHYDAAASKWCRGK